MNDRQLMQQAKAALSAMLTHMGMDEDEWNKPTFDQCRKAEAALRERLAQRQDHWQEEARRYAQNAEFWRGKYEAATAQQQEPVEWGVDWGRAGDQSCVSIIKRLPGGGIEVLATEYGPPASKPLTDEQISNLWCEVTNTDFVTADTHEFARAIEAKLREKNA